MGDSSIRAPQVLIETGLRASVACRLLPLPSHHTSLVPAPTTPSSRKGERTDRFIGVLAAPRPTALAAGQTALALGPSEVRRTKGRPPSRI